MLSGKKQDEERKWWGRHWIGGLFLKQNNKKREAQKGFLAKGVGRERGNASDRSYPRSNYMVNE